MAILRLNRTALAWAFIMLVFRTQAFAQAPEYQVKAAMLYNFALFVEWPASAFPSNKSPFIVGVIGEDPFGPWLKHEMGANIGTHPVEVRHLERAEQGSSCHIVFISRSEEARLRQTLAPLRKAGILSVSDLKSKDEFCREGGMVSFIMQGDKVRFELNTNAIGKAGLRIDSKLMRVAQATDCGE